MKRNRLGLPLFIKYEVVFASALIICFVILLTVFLLIPNLLKMDSIIKEKDALSGSLLQLRNKEKILSEVSVDTYKTTYTKTLSVLPPVSDYVSILRTLSMLEEKTGVVVKTTDFKASISSVNPAAINKVTQSASSSGTPVWISLGVGGTFSQLKEFLAALNKMDGRLLTIYQADYVKNGQDSDELKIIASTYYYAVKTELGSVDSSLPVFDEKKKTMLSTIDSSFSAPAENEAVSTQSGKTDLFE